ncbi:MAG: PQQ-dependent sugar dehydrogenase [Bacillota bacterium]|nr:PQQ-dependent sugar dehydrogenase [Bacillota bacterium]
MSRNNEDNDSRKEKKFRLRKINPKDIQLPKGYTIDVFAHQLTTPISLLLTPDGQTYVADSGITDNNGKILRLNGKHFEVFAEGFNPPLTGINYFNGDIYVSHRGVISIVKPNGKVIDILSGLPSFGDHHNNQVVFGSDGKMYFGQGTATNSGVVGEDNIEWVKKYPFFHDYPASTIYLNGLNFKSRNILAENQYEETFTGAYSPFGIPTVNLEPVKGILKASGSILRANPDGSGLELVAWGLRNPFRIKFDRFDRLFAANHGMDVRGSRPIENSSDEFQVIYMGMWYGWPDYTGGLPVTYADYKPRNYPQPQFLLAQHPMNPPKPFAVFEPHSAIMGFDFNRHECFGPIGDAYIAEFGSEAPETTGGVPLPKVGHRVSRIDISTGAVCTFAVNKSGFAASYTNDGGFERPIDVVFNNKGVMFVVDFGIASEENDSYEKGTGVIWRIRRHD